MIDLETLGQVPGSAIVSIGAYVLETEESFYRVIDLQSCFKAKLTVDSSTIEWWMKQSPDARAVFNDPNKIALNKALLEFSLFVSKQGHCHVWGDGATFDITLTECAYKATGLVAPWKYTNVMCYRTLKNHFKGIEKKRTGVYHKADDDARVNGLHLKAILEKINGN